VKYINSVVITDRERDVEVERMSRYILDEVETSRHLISIRLYEEKFNRDSEFTYIYDCSIECWKCSDSVIYIFFILL
jgi:hypothetical protein